MADETQDIMLCSPVFLRLHCVDIAQFAGLTPKLIGDAAGNDLQCCSPSCKTSLIFVVPIILASPFKTASLLKRALSAFIIPCR